MKHRLFRIGQHIMLALGLGLGLTLALLWAMRGELTPPAYAATYTVNITSDSFDGTCTAGSCSLRDAIYVANTTAGDDTINVPAGTYNLSITGRDEDIGAKGDLDILGTSGESLTIMGNSPGNTIINANSLDRVFDIQPIGITTVTLENLTITGGLIDQGGGIRIRPASLGTPHLVLNNVIIAGNTITGTNQTPYPDGGGGLLNVQAMVTLNNCQVYNNTAIVAGGGLGNLGLMTLVNTSVSTNIVQSGSGGGIGNAGVLYLSNSPVSNNQALNPYGLSTEGVGDGGGIGNQSTGPGLGVVTLVNSLISNNQAAAAGGGIASTGGSLTLSNSPVSGNSSAAGGGIVQSTGGQLILSNSPVSSNTLKSFTSTRPGLGNGGGIVFGANGGGVMTATDSAIFNNTAVATTTAQGGGMMVGGSVWLINSPVISNTANQVGGGIGNTSDGNLTLNNSPVLSNTLYGSSSEGGGILNNGRLDLTNSPISNNWARYGGGLENYSSAVAALTSSDVTNNHAFYGGGIYNLSHSVMTLTTLIVADNVAGGKGGGIVNDTSYLRLSDVSVSYNQAITTGGGIWQAEGSLIMQNSAVVNNDTDGNGGGLSIGYTSTVAITNSTFSGNTAYTDDSTNSSGGGLYEGDSWPKTITLNNVTIADNEADLGGGLARNGSGVIKLANTLVASNTALVTDGNDDISGTVTSAGYNLIGNSTGATLTGDLTGNITDQEADLGTLTDSPAYYPLLVSSPAIDAGNPAVPGGDFPACAATDQPGTTRPQGLACDIGAFEASIKKTYLPLILK